MLGASQLYQVGTMDPLFIKEGTKGQRRICSWFHGYRAMDLVFNHALFQTAPGRRVSKVVLDDGIPCEKIDASLCDWSRWGLSPTLGCSLSPPTCAVQICQLNKIPRSPRRAQNRQLLSRSTLVWQVCFGVQILSRSWTPPEGGLLTERCVRITYLSAKSPKGEESSAGSPVSVG